MASYNNYSKIYFLARKIIKTEANLNAYKSPFYNDEPKLYTYLVEYKRKKGLEIIGSGTSSDKRKAYVKSVFEAIERYSLSPHNAKKSFIYASSEELSNSVHLSSFLSFSNRQLHKKLYKDIYPSSKDKIYWTDAEDLINMETVKIPAQTIYLPYDLDDKYLRLPISTGAALSTEKEDAIKRGILEIIERDAFITSYLAKFPGTKVDLDRSDREIEKIVDEYRFYRLSPIVIKLDSDFSISTFLTILVDRTGIGPHYTFGLKSDRSAKDAIIGSLEEAFHSRCWIRDEMDNRNESEINKLIKNQNKVDTILERGIIWSQKESENGIRHWLNNKKIKSYDEIVNKSGKITLDYMLNELAQKKFDCFVKEMISEFSEKYNLVVYKTVIPQAHPLYLDENYRYWDTKRIKMNGGKDIVNKYIHPFL